jgi:GNAT superfamily N-acetyltransferase
MRLVELTKLDPRFLATSLRDFYQAAYSTPSYTYSDADMDEFEERFFKHSQYSGFQILGAVVDDEVVAFTYGFTFPEGRWWGGSIEDPPPEVIGKKLFGLIELAVSENHRGKGIAKTLHNVLLSSRQEDFVTLLSRPDSVAHAIYPRWGYKHAGRVRSYPSWPVDDVFLKSLPFVSLQGSASVDAPSQHLRFASR